MQLTPSTLEQVTALTNLPLVRTSLAAVACLWRRRQAHPLRAWLWIGMFGGLAIASGVGVFAHGLAFGHNGVFHLVQLPGLLRLVTGLHIGLGPKLEGESNATGMFPNALRFP
jgi:predicted lipid-binding transport protein (Tim44 family)